MSWAEANPAVHAVVLTSTRARAEGPSDNLSDYDVIVSPARTGAASSERELPPNVADELATPRGSFEQTVELFRRVAREVGDALGHEYPQCADDVVSAYIDRLRDEP